MRKEIFSATLDGPTVEVLAAIAESETKQNRSEALRRIVAEAGARRGLLPISSDQKPVIAAGVQHA